MKFKYIFNNIIHAIRTFDYRGTAERALSAVTGAVHKAPQFLRREVPLLPSRIKAFFKSLPGYFGQLKNFVLRYAQSLQESPRTRFLTSAWGIGIMFFAVCALSASNPFRLLVPGLAFPLPVRDQRQIVPMYGINRESGKPVRVSRLLLRSDNNEIMAKRVVFSISHVLSLADSAANPEMGDLDILPELGFALRRIWAHDLHGRNTLVLDFDRAILNDETRKFARSRTGDKKPEQYLDVYFQTLTMSLFSAVGGIDTIVYLLDGDSRQIPGMLYDLKKAYTKADAGL